MPTARSLDCGRLLLLRHLFYVCSAAKITVTDFLYKFLKSKFGLETAVVEFGYNLVDALQVGGISKPA